MEEKLLVLKNKNGEVVRSFNWDGQDVPLIYRLDLKRLELAPSLETLREEEIPFDVLDKVTKQNLPILVGNLGKLDWSESEALLSKDVKPMAKDEQNTWWTSFILVFLIQAGLLTAVFFAPPMPPALQVIEEHVVKIDQPPPEVKKAQVQQNHEIPPEVKKANVQKSVKRLGALAVLGSLKSGKQRGGLNLGAVNTSAGPGLGGTQGSGGMQTSLYAKGLIASPLGAGARADGAGGYGTKGKGGGLAGYGELSLVGSAGTSAIPLGTEAIVDGGLDRDAIAEVIDRNSGQIRFCYEQGLQGDPRLTGRVAVNFTIGGNGSVKVASVGNTSLNSKLVEDCILMRLS